MLSAYLLVSHGSRDPRPEIAMQQLAGHLCNKLQTYLPDISNGGVASPPNSTSKCQMVGTAYLELCSPLHEQIIKFAQDAAASGCDRLKIIPLFLLPGVHVMEDIPAEVAQARIALGNIRLHLQPYLGSHPGLGRLLALTTQTAKILLAHGSRRAGSQQPTEAMAADLAAVTAYWSVPPSLELRVTELVSAGYREIGIIPYFLFAGGITDAIAEKVEELKLQFPEVSFDLAEPLGASAQLADLIWDLIRE